MSSESDRGTSPSDRQTELTLAKWSTRFWAWLVDFIIITIVVEVIFALAYAPLAFAQAIQDNPFLSGVRAVTQSLLFFAYWLYFESTSGQSIGKKLLKIRTTDLTGNTADAKNIAIQSFGKAFLLPFDVILGWIFTNDKRQRIFSRAGNTIVIKSNDTAGQDVRYIKE
ncbi:MAG: RDD family protein [Thermoproteota archaeon]